MDNLLRKLLHYATEGRDKASLPSIALVAAARILGERNFSPECKVELTCDPAGCIPSSLCPSDAMAIIYNEDANGELLEAKSMIAPAQIGNSASLTRASISEKEIASTEEGNECRNPGALLPGIGDSGPSGFCGRQLAALSSRRLLHQGRRHCVCRRAVHGRNGQNPEPEQVRVCSPI